MNDEKWAIWSRRFWAWVGAALTAVFGVLELVAQVSEPAANAVLIPLWAFLGAAGIEVTPEQQDRVRMLILTSAALSTALLGVWVKLRPDGATLTSSPTLPLTLRR